MFRKSLVFVWLFVIVFAVSARNANSNNWLQGYWGGTGYQVSDNSTWTMKLGVVKGKYLINYPSLECGGEWRFVSMNHETATFVERITYDAKGVCQDDANVVVERLNNTQILFKWSFPGATKLDASAILNRSD